ncbi:MAG: PAS domain S-box protein, partial [Desulfobacteraceae bacterium]|nr:PAS domain S-box protein [Desulfobacteraceae bacterium]
MDHQITQPSFPSKAAFFILSGVLILCFIVGGYGFYHHEANVVEAQKYDELKAIADLKTQEIAAWRQEREADARIRSTGIIRADVIAWLKAPADGTAMKMAIKERFKTLQEGYKSYDNIILAGTDGRVLLSLDTEMTELEPQAQQLAEKAVSTNNVAFGDFFQCSYKKRIHLDVAAPVLGADNRPAAVLILRTDPAQFLFPLIQTWPMPNKTAETLIVRRNGDNVVFLNTLRHRPNPPLTIRIPISKTDLPAARAALGQTGLFRGHDYRGVDVLADIRPVPGSPWFMVTKEDADEILAGLRYRGIVIGTVTLMLTLLAGISAGYIYKHQGKRAFQALYHSERDRRKAEAEFKTTLYSIGDAVISTDINGKIRQMNPVAERLTGWTETEAKGKPVDEVFRIISESTGETVDSPVQKVLEKGLIVGLANHTLLISKNGERIPIADSGAPIRDESNDINGVVLVFRDQTRERDIDRLLRARLLLLEYAASHSLDDLLQKTVDEVCILTQSPIGFYHFVEPDQKTLSLQAWSTRTMQEFCKAEGKGPHYSIDQAGVWVDCVHSKKPVIHNDYASLPHKKGMPDGHAAVIREMVAPILRGGKVVAVIGVGNKPVDYTEKDIEKVAYLADVAWEITLRKQAARSLMESEALFRLLSENLPTPYHSLDAQGNILDINAKWLAELGYASEEVIGKWFGDFLAGNGPDLFRQRFEAFKSAGEVHGIEFDMKHKDGGVINVSFEGRISRDASNEFGRTHCVFVNITEHKRMEEALRSEKTFSDTMINSMPGIFYLFDKDGHLLRWNRNFEIVSGYSSEEMSNMHPLGFFSGEDKDRVEEAIQEAFAKG